MFFFLLFYVLSQVLFTMLLILIVICLCAHKCQSSIKIYTYKSSYIVYIIEENDLRNYEESFCQNENYANYVFCFFFNIFTYIVYRINNLTKL